MAASERQSLPHAHNHARDQTNRKGNPPRRFNHLVVAQRFIHERLESAGAIEGQKAVPVETMITVRISLWLSSRKKEAIEVSCTRFRRHELGVLWSRRCVMERRQYAREFKLEAVRLIKERGVSYAQAAEDLGVHPTQLRDWVKKLADDPQHAFPGQAQMKPEQLEIAQLKREVAKLKAERGILKKAAAYFAKEST
jgi:transposase